MAPDELGEVNRKYWDEQAQTLFTQHWVTALTAQLRDSLQSNVGWINMRKRTEAGEPVKLIDYACGNGMVSNALFDHADIIRGVDVSSVMAAEYNKAAREAGISPERMVAYQGNFLDRSPDDETQDLRGSDAIVMSMALHHTDDPVGMLSEFAQRLRSDGVVVVIDWIPGEADAANKPDTDAHSHHAHGHAQAKEQHDAHPTFAKNLDLSEATLRDAFVKTGYAPQSFAYLPYKELSHIPEEVTKTKGGRNRRFFLAKARKL